MKVLLAEKDDSLGNILFMLLKSFGYDAVVTKTAQETLEALKTEAPDLILLDKDLKDQDGLEVSKIIKTDFLTAYIPIIVLIDRRQVRKDLLQIEQGIDDYILKPPDPIDLQVRIEMAVRRVTHQCFANALTKLPGNRTIETMVSKIIDSGRQFSFGYIDIDRFKNFNDCYGYFKGDIVIIQTAHIISRSIKYLGDKNDFVGHVGGDDFVIITNPEKENEVALEIIKEFDRLMPYHYSQEDRKRGYVQVRNRQGKVTRIPLMSISIALIDNMRMEINTHVQLSEIASEIKRYLKTVSGSKFLKNRRVENSGLLKRAKEADEVKRQIKAIESKNTKKPLGQILLETGTINESVLGEALMKHWRTGQTLGQTLVTMGLLDQDKIKVLLDKQ